MIQNKYVSPNTRMEMYAAPSESHWVCDTYPIKVRKNAPCGVRSIKVWQNTWYTDGQPDGRTPYRYITLTARPGQCNKREKVKPGLVTLHNIQPGNRLGLLLQLWGPHEAKDSLWMVKDRSVDDMLPEEHSRSWSFDWALVTFFLFFSPADSPHRFEPP